MKEILLFSNEIFELILLQTIETKYSYNKNDIWCQILNSTPLHKSCFSQLGQGYTWSNLVYIIWGFETQIYFILYLFNNLNIYFKSSIKIE